MVSSGAAPVVPLVGLVTVVPNRHHRERIRPPGGSATVAAPHPGRRSERNSRSDGDGNSSAPWSARYRVQGTASRYLDLTGVTVPQVLRHRSRRSKGDQNSRPRHVEPQVARGGKFSPPSVRSNGSSDWTVGACPWSRGCDAGTTVARLHGGANFARPSSREEPDSGGSSPGRCVALPMLRPGGWDGP